MYRLNIGRCFNTLLLLLVVSSVHAQEVMILGVPELAPFTYLDGNDIEGDALKPIQQIMTNSNIPYKLVYLENYTKLLKAVRKQSIHGFFLATKNVERDKYAEFSIPILMDSYSWFILNQAPYELNSEAFKLNAKVGAVNRTNSFRLATRRGYQVYGQPSPLLAQQFINQTIDAVFATQSPFEYQLQKLKFPKNRYRIEFESDRPFGIYVSKQYIRRHPDTMTLINQQIKALK
ncbi:MAG: transporter substrate-binding domain-containing protein [Gammaproteobacteria bacterium]|nr:transporter substrate-binding domain-containing protein [Gammaproteobacteria bacterium]